MKAINENTWNNAVEYGDFEKLPAGGYVCVIKAVEDVPDKEYLYITYDIAEGRYAFFYADDWGRDNAWAHRFIRSYKESAIGMFKGFLKAVDESNKTNFSEQITAGFNEHQLVGKLVGLILAEEEYESNRGDIRKSLVVHRIVPIEKIRTGDYRVPGLKRLEVKNTSPAGFVPGSDNDLPF